jgi:WhiB family transcriptional regulator, redox-sensing transcriptional regulator
MVSSADLERRGLEQDDWRNDAACVEHAATVDFFPERGASVRAAKAVCAECPVRQPCLEYALKWNHLSGVWGGLSERERRLVRRRRRGARHA